MEKFLERIEKKNPQQLGSMIRSYKSIRDKVQGGFLYMPQGEFIQVLTKLKIMIDLKNKRKLERTYAHRSGLVVYWDSFC